jgi:Fe2+ transport system protein FeoA
LEAVKKQRTQGGRKGMITAKLNDLKPGQRGKVVKVSTRGETNRRIVEMGVTPGAVVEVERVAPLGDPIDVRVKGYHLSLRKEEAAGIEVENL